ncbi:MAG: GIY-YIG nuclease family protein [Bermanella sp.]
MAWYVYILRCQDDSLYTGVCTDLTRRVQEHNLCNKKGARYTRARRPVTIVYREDCENRSEACQREAAIKKLKRQQKLTLIQHQLNSMA